MVRDPGSCIGMEDEIIYTGTELVMKEGYSQHFVGKLTFLLFIPSTILKALLFLKGQFFQAEDKLW
jgi:hypothetical protein